MSGAAAGGRGAAQVRRVLRRAAIVAGAALTGACIGLTAVALPLFALARAVDPERGTGRAFVHTGLVEVAPAAGVVAGVAAGTGAAVWTRRRGDPPRRGGAA